MSNESQPPDGLTKLLEGFMALRETASAKAWSTRFHNNQLLPGPSRLEAVARLLEAEGKQPVRTPPPRLDLEEAREQWQRYLTTQDPNQIEWRAVRRLCWDPEVAPTAKFLRLLEGSNRSPSAPMILGLLGVYHLLWDNEKGDLERCVTKWLQTYQGCHPLLHRLCERVDEVSGPHAAEYTARSAFENRRSVRSVVEQRGLALSTPYAFSAAGHLINAHLYMLERSRNLDQARYICEQLLPADRDLLLFRPEAFASAVKHLVALASKNQDPHLRNVVKDFVLREERLGDPRRHPGRWDNMGLSAEAATVTGWLSEEDLQFFFDLIMEGQEDKHHRREFWLRYVYRVRNSRVAIGEADRQRLRLQLSDLKKRGRAYATLDDWGASAFVMDFGPVIVVEFSQTGNACSVHEAASIRQRLGNFQADSFYKTGLKKRLRSPGWFRHDAEGHWRHEVRQYLARFGVRE